MQSLEAFLQTAMADPETGWNMGGFGAIAEFHQVESDPPAEKPDTRALVTTRGGLRLDSLANVQPVAWENLSADPRRWTQGVSLCLAEDQAPMHQRSVLTEIGRDPSPLRQRDGDAILFDMGLNQLQVDFCVRTSEPELVRTLRSQAGRSLMEHGNPALAAILAHHPHRVALTRLGRIEVYQKIGGADTGGRSPQGPHTHVLPKLLRTGRSHSANQPIPPGWIPCCGVHPENPVMDRLGADKDLNRKAFEKFQQWLQSWGVSDYVHSKQVAWHALEAAKEPDAIPRPHNRTGRTALRNAIRQFRRIHGDSALVAQWIQAYDRNTDDSTGPEDTGFGERH
jgi:hypothetical protein